MVLTKWERNSETSFDNVQSSPLSTPVENSQTTRSIETQCIKKRDDDGSLSFDYRTNRTNEINAYINDPIRTKRSLYSKNSQLLPLKNVARRVLSTQASSAAVERVFI